MLSFNLTMSEEIKGGAQHLDSNGAGSTTLQAAMKSPTKLGAWYTRILWVGNVFALAGKGFQEELKDFCNHYVAPLSIPPARKTYQVDNIDDLADLSIRFLGVGTERLRKTIERSVGLSPMKKVDGKMRHPKPVPIHNFPQGRWKTGKTPKVEKGIISDLHYASIGEAVFMDTFEVDDSSYRYGQAFVDYRSNYGDIIPMKSRSQVGWAFTEFCARHYTPLILIRDNIGENVGGDLLRQCLKRSVRSAFICPYRKQQNYAEGYLGRVTALASFAMVYSGAPMFMWKWSITCAVFINNITASFYSTEQVWATPHELTFNEPFSDASIVVPFGCGVLVLLTEEERGKFKSRCALMIFIHYANQHPLYTYAVYSPRTRKVLFRQDCIFLTNLFPMRTARAREGLNLEGDSIDIIPYRSPISVRHRGDDTLSFQGWDIDQRLPEYQDHITGHKLNRPAIEAMKSSDPKPRDYPCVNPNDPRFGPPSVVKVPYQKGQAAHMGEADHTREDDEVADDMRSLNDEPGGSDGACEGKRVMPKRNSAAPKATSSAAPKATSKSGRIPAHQRFWYYEPVLETALSVHQPARDGVSLILPTQNSGMEGVQDEVELSPDTEELIKNLCQAEDKYEAAIAAQPWAANEIEAAEYLRVANSPEMVKLRRAYPIENGTDPLREDDVGSALAKDSTVYNLPEELGMVQEIPLATLEKIMDNESGACFLSGILFEDDGLGWCRITGWGIECGILVMFYSPLLGEDAPHDEEVISLAELLCWIKQSSSPPVVPKFEPSRLLQRSEQKRMNLCYRQQSYGIMQPQTMLGNCNVRQFGAKVGSYDGQIISDRVIRRILRAQETIFKYGTLIPRNDAEANRSPEAKRWMSGKQLEWLRLQGADTFERQWTWDKVRLVYPEYKKGDIGHMFFIYDYKFSGEHRVRLVFDGSRQSEATYSNTYAPTVRPESVRLFHIYAVEYSWTIKQYDVPQAFLRSKADCDIFVYPPNGFAEFPGQLLKLAKMLYGSKQAAHLWYNLLNDFLLEVGFTSSFMDPCFYRRIAENGDIDAIIILHVDDMRVAANDIVTAEIYTMLFDKFEITTSDSGRFLGMDADYDMDKGILCMHMETYIRNTVDRFRDFDISRGIPYREIVGSLLWIVLCIMGPELLRVKDLARRSNHFVLEDYEDAIKVLKRIEERMKCGIIYRRGGAGKETVPRNTRLGGDNSIIEESAPLLLMSRNSGESSSIGETYSVGDLTNISEFKESDAYKLDEYEDSSLEIPKLLEATNERFTTVAYSDASFASTEMKQSISGLVVMINGTPILWSSLKQTGVVDSTCSSEYVAASVCSKQIMQVENMVQFLKFTCPKPYTMYTDSQACLQIANTSSKLGKVRHIEIRYHLVRCLIIAGSIKLIYCITEDMIADLFTKVVSGTQDQRLAVRFYNDCNILLFIES
jgi:hypothetical protein